VTRSSTKPEEQTIVPKKVSRVAIRDYIPQGEELTPAEAARLKGVAAVRTGGFRPDFVPDEGYAGPKPPFRREAQAEAALNKALERQAHAAENERRVAEERLAAWSVSDAITAIAQMPSRVADLYVACEKHGAQREDILNRFAEPDPAVVEFYFGPTETAPEAYEATTKGKSDAETGTASEAPEE
jgi:hypothetical protein